MTVPSLFRRAYRGLHAVGAATREQAATPETMAGLSARAETEHGPWTGASDLGVMMAADYRELPVFRDAVRAACDAGLTGIGMRVVTP